MGSPPSTSSPCNLHPHRKRHLALGHPFFYLYTHPKLLFIYLVIVKILCLQHLLRFLSSPLMTLFFLQHNACFPWLGNPYPLLILTSFINPEYPTVHVPMIFNFVHFVTPLAQFNPMSSRPSDTRYNFIVYANHPSNVPPTKGSLESHRILTSFMFPISS
jgi:hypothetical protein